MGENYKSLSDLIQILTSKSKVHICIHDISGILGIDELKVNPANKLHSKNICALAKSSKRGYDLCIRCKCLANSKAINTQSIFCGYCPFGIFEVVKPVVIDSVTECIIYVGNIVPDVDKTSKAITKTCKITKSPENQMLSELENAETTDSPDYYISVAEIIDSYIRLIRRYNKPVKPENKMHWAVQSTIEYSEANFENILTLKNISKLYYINEKYLGKMFKQQMGITFHEYINNLRLEKSKALLISTNKNIIDIALESGFQNVTYYNRVFMKKYNITPSKYKELHK